MNAPGHHPSAELLLDMARGAVNAGRALVAEAHLAVCPECRRLLFAAESLGGALLEELPPAPMAPDSLARTLGRLGEIERPTPKPRATPPAGWIAAPAPAIEALSRRRWLAPGVWTAQVRLEQRPPGYSYLLGIGPGISVPRHTHLGLETLCVLKGAFEDRGDTIAAGDFVESDDSVVHRPKVWREEACVCLVWTENALQPRSLLGRLMQPIAGI